MNVSGVRSAQPQQGHHRPPPLSDKALSAVADKLGMSSDDFKTALKDGGNLKEIADKKGVSGEDIRAAIQSAGDMPAPPQGPMGPNCGGHPDHEAIDKAVSEKLGIDADALKEAFKTPDGLKTLLDSNSISQEQFQSAMASVFESRGAMVDTSA